MASSKFWMRLLVGSLAVGCFASGCLLPNYEKAGVTGPGSDTASVSSCCSLSDSFECGDTDVQECVCATDTFCCEYGWDASCIAEIEELGCGSCPAGAAEEATATEAEPMSCGSSGQCDPSAPVCDDGTCVQCVSDADCAAGFADFPYCGDDRACGECKMDGDCEALYGADYAFCSAGLCLACRTDADCAEGSCQDGYCE